jgi:hypothetical protein
LRAARGWSLAQTARVFQLTTTTIASWNSGPVVVTFRA